MKTFARTLLFAFLTAAALALLLWFARFTAERTGSIAWAILIAGVAASASVALYVFGRWQAGNLVGDTLEQVKARLAPLRARLAGDAAAPVTRADLREAGRELAALVPLGLRLAGVALGLLLVMTIMLEVITLANAAVMYLQTKRLEEQNALLATQNRQLDHDLLRELIVTQEALAEALRAIGTLPENIDDLLISPFSILPQFVGGETSLAVDESFDFDPCEGADDCRSGTFGDFLDQVRAGEIAAAAENVEWLKSFYHLTKFSEYLALLFLTQENDRNWTQSIKFVSDMIESAILNCGSADAARAAGLWRGLSSAGYGALQSWGEVAASDIAPGFSLPLPDETARGNFMMMGAGFGLVFEATGGGSPEEHPAPVVADRLGAALRELASAAEGMKTDCIVVRDEITTAAALLVAERRAIIARLSETAGAAR